MNALDETVARLEGVDYLPAPEYDALDSLHEATCYSTDWRLAGPIIERERFDISWLPRQQEYCCYAKQHGTDGHIIAAGFGDTLLIAAMRCYVNLKERT